LTAVTQQSKLKILFLSRWYPYPADNGTRLRVFNILRQLSKEAEIDLYSLTMEEVSPERIAAMHPICRRVEVYPEPPVATSGWRSMPALFSARPRSIRQSFSADFQRAVSTAAREREYDVIIAATVATAHYALPQRAPVKLFEEAEISLLESYVDVQSTSSRKLRATLACRKLARYVAQLSDSFDIVTAVSQRELEKLELWAGRSVPNGRVAPNGVAAELLERPAVPRRPNSLIYAGALTFDANLDAVRWFLEECYPLIRTAVPDVTFTVTGSTKGVDLSALQTDESVHFSGWVEDVQALVAEQTLSVVPLRLGGGTRLKILESMAVGTPVVATAKGAEGLAVEDGVHLAIADDAQEFANAVVRLLGNDDERSRYAQAGRELVAAHHTWPAIADDLLGAVREVRVAKGLEPAPQAGRLP
jgi:glycosyltransferase involved in cell wall biosynthesis